MVVAFGQIIKPHVLAVLPMVNVHFSLLPRWRGAAPVERAILAGDDVTGRVRHALEEGLDTGGVYAVRSLPIGDTVTADELRAELVAAGTELLVETLAAPRADWIADAHPQEGEATYAAEVHPPTTSRSTGPRRSSTSTASSASAAPGRPSGRSA